MKSSRFETALNQFGLALPETGDIAVLRASSRPEYALMPAQRTYYFNSFRPDFEQLEKMGLNVGKTPDGKFSMALISITRSKSESLGLIGRAVELVGTDGMIVVDGEKWNGIESVLKHCKSVFQIENVISKSHGKLFWFRRPALPPASAPDWRKNLDLAKNKSGFFTSAGMFSPDQPDKGSLLLAQQFAGKLKGHLADLGAGWGWLAAQALAQDAVTGIDLYEAENLALDAAKANIRDKRASFHWQDVTDLRAEQTYDTVICNPPFHQSRAADPSLGLAFIHTAANILKPNGTLWLVANRQLPYEAGLEMNFKHWKHMAQETGFKTILATKPLSPQARQKRQFATQNR